jgi:Fe-S cluster assembly ATPase SufC
MASTGLNVFLGERSSGKTYTLNRISAEHPNVKYIKQFSLVQLDEAQYERDFNSELERRRSRHTEDYLHGFKAVVDEIIGIDLDAHDRALGNYLESLLRSAEESDLADSFSKTRLFSETTFKIGDDESLKSLIEAVRHLIENVDHRPSIEKHIELNALRALAVALIEMLWERNRDRVKKQFVNRMVEDIKQQLAVRTAAIQVPDIDFYGVLLDQKKVERFEAIVRALRSEAVIFQTEMQGFRIVAKKSAHSGASELKATSGRKIAFSDAMKQYDEPYQYLRQLMTKSEIPDSELYRYFVKIGYEILNRDGYPVSGGERSEYRLLQEISDAQSYDLLLIDEPESSFDNVFLNDNVNALIRAIARTMPVIVVTHNSTVGASIGADYLLCARKEITAGRVLYRIFSGYPTDKLLQCVDGATLANHQALLASLEAGEEAYEARRRGYEAVKHY